MDKLNNPPSVITKRETMHHFSHPHPLEPTSTNPTGKNLTCSGCKLSITPGDDSYYHCTPCAFSLHRACINMPMIAKHPSHSKHDLVLFVMPSKSTFNCVACGNHLAGFCYHCPECSTIFFHALCLALPLSVTTTRHVHAMELAFAPPYDFFCDLCNKPSYKGWLYRCGTCEFDTHVACAVRNMDPQQSAEPRVGHETVMPLVAQQIGVAADKKLLYGHNKTDVNKVVEMDEEEERSPLRDKTTPLSDASTPSHQLSEAYFSIDIANSYSAANHDRRRLASRTPGRPVKKEPLYGAVNLAGNNNNGSYNDGARQSKLSISAIFEEASGGSSHNNTNNLAMKAPNESLAKWSVNDQTNNAKSDSRTDSPSGWRKFLPCCL